MPSLGAVKTVDGDHDGDLIGYTFQSCTQPLIAFVADARAGRANEIVRLRMPERLDVASIAVKQTTYPSKDGTEVTMSLVHRKDVAPTGHVPTLLSGYGGVNITGVPATAAGVAVWGVPGR